MFCALKVETPWLNSHRKTGSTMVLETDPACPASRSETPNKVRNAT
jgi:hypothetical protein